MPACSAADRSSCRRARTRPHPGWRRTHRPTRSAQRTRSAEGVKAALMMSICAGWIRILPAKPSAAAASASRRSPSGSRGSGQGVSIAGTPIAPAATRTWARARTTGRRVGPVGMPRADPQIGRQVLRSEADGAEPRRHTRICAKGEHRGGGFGDDRHHADAADRGPRLPSPALRDGGRACRDRPARCISAA